MIEIASILPTAHLNLEAESDMHMMLAHLVCDPEYTAFFKWQAARGAFILMDNGVVETGEALPFLELFRIATKVGVTEMTLPDVIRDRKRTQRLHEDALNILDSADHLGYPRRQRVMVIPQGDSQEDWICSVNDMLKLAKEYPQNVMSVGISKFCTGDGMFGNRLQALSRVPQLIESDLEIHLLGCPEHPSEIRHIDNAFPRRIRGVDSGLPTFYTLHGERLNEVSVRPHGIELDFDTVFVDEKLALLKRNIHAWKWSIQWSGLR